MKLCAELTHHDDEAKFYDQYATRLSKAIVPTFWSDEAGALIHAVGSGEKGKMVERYANIFAILFDFLNDGQKQTVARTVLHNPAVMPITTPYMRFYEMEALCLLGEQDDVLRQMKDYWGGMIAHGATSFWEAYDRSTKTAWHRCASTCACMAVLMARACAMLGEQAPYIC